MSDLSALLAARTTYVHYVSKVFNCLSQICEGSIHIIFLISKSSQAVGYCFQYLVGVIA
jgi:hypothetical protein